MKEKKNYLPEIEKLKNWALDVWGFIGAKAPELKQVQEMAIGSIQRFPIANNRQILLGFRESTRDLRSIAKEALKPADFNELNLFLLGKYGLTIEKDNSRTIILIIGRGKINSEFEARFVKDYLDDTNNINEGTDTYVLLNKMLAAYEDLL